MKSYLASMPGGLSVTGAVVAALIAVSASRLILRHAALRGRNWRGKVVRKGYGISFPLAQGLALLSWWIFGDVGAYSIRPFQGEAFSLRSRGYFGEVGCLAPTLPTLALFGMAGIGLMDDLSGESPGGGFRRHLGAFLRHGRVSVGFLKAFLGGVLCLGFGISVAGVPWGILDGLVLALCSNAVNLLDVRPGRAGKAAFAAYLVSLVASPADAMPYLPVLLAAALFFPADCRGRVMMGDVGAYPLGFAIGLGLLALSLPVKASLCCLLVAFHLYCEVRSVSVAIERNKLLKWMDGWWVRE